MFSPEEAAKWLSGEWLAIKEEENEEDFIDPEWSEAISLLTESLDALIFSLEAAKKGGLPKEMVRDHKSTIRRIRKFLKELEE